MPKTRWPQAGSLCLVLFTAGCALAQPESYTPSARTPAEPAAVQGVARPAQDYGRMLYQAPSQAPGAADASATSIGVRAGSIALLLPLSGSFSTTGEAVRDGFLAAHFNSRGQTAVRVYDVGSRDDLLQPAYQRALSEGAALIVGPLRKESVAQLASWNPPVPVIALNYLDDGIGVPFNFLQMGLAPEDEARAAADHALQQNRRRAVALVPQTEAGERAYAAFEQRLREHGGSVVRVARYVPGRADQSQAIEGLMGGAASEERHRALTSTLGIKTVFESRRRGDLDLIFMVARASDARLLAPQFRFHRSGDLPIYATAQVYDGGRGDADRAGIRFCDTPWTVGDALIWAPQRLEVEGLASVTALPRLHALGRDAQRVAQGLIQGSLRRGDGLDGASGRLQWRDSGQIERAPECVQLRSDGVRPLSAPTGATRLP